MIKTYRVPFVLILLGMVVTIIGSLFKIMHWPGANLMLIIGMLIEALAIIVLIIVLLKNAK